MVTATSRGDHPPYPPARQDRPVRRAGRVIVLDPGNRVLLLRYDSLHYGVHWGTPGGGLETGEDYHAAAVRELGEETGWHDVVVDAVAVHEETRTKGPQSTFSASVHRFFMARVPVDRRPLADGLAEMHSADGITGSRWWTLAELEATTDAMWPTGLASLMRELVLPVRHAGRVIVLDPGNRVLLFRYEAPRVHWATPGGGLDPGEDYRAAAVRELREETGWDDVPVGEELPEVCGWRPILHADRPVRQYERYFLARVPAERRPVADVDGMHAFDGIGAYHWWSLAELETTEDVVYPTGLADVLRGLASLLWHCFYLGMAATGPACPRARRPGTRR
jgi:ADP-ribose pyrophosphatase YjhB (NUDIX family)